MLNNKQYLSVTKALQKRLDKMMDRADQDQLEWFGDIETERDYTWKFVNPADGTIKGLVYGYQSKTVTVVCYGSVSSLGTAGVTKLKQTAEEMKRWEDAWEAYIRRLKRLEELERMGRYGYQLRMPKQALDNAVKRLRELDAAFCKQIGI